MSALDELLARWRENPDSGTTLALCAFLGSSKREDLILEVGATAEAWHREDPQVMLALGRMYLDAGLLQEAQAALVTAGKLNASSSQPYRFLGEVLLRRGDAQRAEKVLARALQIGQSDADTRMWHDRAVVYVALQQRVGLRAVADEIERTVPKKTSIPPPTVQASFQAPSVPTATGVRRSGAAAHRYVEPAAKAVGSRSAKFGSKPSSVAEATREELLSEGDIPTGQFGRDTIDLTHDDLESSPLASLHGASAHTAQTVKRRAPSSPPQLRSVPSSPAKARSPLPPPPVFTPPPARVPSSLPPPPAFALSGASPSSLPLPPPPAPFSPPSLGRSAPEPQPRVPSSLPPPPVAPAPVLRAHAPLPRSAPPAAEPSVRPGGFDDSPSPAAETVLEHLARVGVYERNGGAAAAWIAPPKEKRRGTWVFAIAIVLAGSAGYGAFAYASKVRADRMATARSLEAETVKLLSTGSVDDLKKTDEKLSTVFDLDSRSEKAALLWLENRVLSALLVPGETRGIEAAMSRCRTLGIDESKTVFGKIASFMVEGDLAGAAAILPKWDEKAKTDPMYQLAAGALLERAGDVRAIGRYEQAFKLDPGLVLARVFHAELAALELGYESGKPSLDEAVKSLGDRPMARALEGLTWMTSNAQGDLPQSAVVPPAERSKLPAQLLSVPHVVDARVHALAGRATEAIAALDDALRVSATPAMASYIGQVAIDLGDEKLARAATLRALSYSALYPRARSLAARVALLGGRIDEAKSAIQELDASSKEVAVVRAAAAYEALDLSELDGASSQIGAADGPAKALAAGVGIALGKKYPAAAALEQFASPSVPWGDLVAVDAALDLGNLELARKISTRWGDRGTTPAYALRRARLARYDGKAEDAVKASEESMVAGGVTPRVLIERVLALLAAKDVQGARAVVSQYPVVLGPMTKLLSIVVNVEAGKAALAKSDAATVEPPPDGSPVLYELLAARALIAVDDRRGKVILAGLSRRLPKHPDVVAMLQSLAAR